MAETNNRNKAYTNKVYKIICEGDSEKAYIQEINRIIRTKKKHMNILLQPINVGSGDFSAVRKAYAKAYRNNKKTKIKIWVDRDIYERNEQKNHENYLNKSENIPDFLFSTYNFEDFLVMHLDDNTINHWQQILDMHNHFEIPLTAKRYIDLIERENIFKKNYKKGELPFEITFEKITQAYKTHQDENIKFKCDFLDFLFSLGFFD